MKLIILNTPELVKEFFGEAQRGNYGSKKSLAVSVEEDSKVLLEDNSKLFPVVGDLLVFSEGKVLIDTPHTEKQMVSNKLPKEPESKKKIKK